MFTVIRFLEFAVRGFHVSPLTLCFYQNHYLYEYIQKLQKSFYNIYHPLIFQWLIHHKRILEYYYINYYLEFWIS